MALLTAFLAALTAGAVGDGYTETVVVSATRLPRPLFDTPAAIDAVDARAIAEDNPRVNLSEALSGVPGIVVANRQNYAQDLQVSVRGFGARATFGVRGVRLIADGIPATMPDGQGQASTFDLATAERIEVLRGPFAALYGNSSGGVVQVFTADGPKRPTLEATLAGGSYDQGRAIVRFGGEAGPVNYIASASRYESAGYRDHSGVVRDQAHAKVKARVGGGTLTVVAGALDQPETQDPLGLTRELFEQNPRQSVAATRIFDTRKSVRQVQAGVVYDLELTPRDALQARLYHGTRDLEQFLGFPGDGMTASGAVIVLDREYGGAGLRWTRRLEAAGRPLVLTVGADHDRMDEHRRGFVNERGRRGALRRDEDDIVTNTDYYAIAEWSLHPRWVASGGVRASRVAFESRDHYVTPANPDDSGRARFRNTTPVAGLLYRASPTLNVYVNAGEGFETPTFSELAYRPGGATGLNFDLRAAKSRHLEAGFKLRLGGGLRADGAVFRIATRDEIVAASSSGGRTVFANAARTLREGYELALRSRLGGGFEAAAAVTGIRARFEEPFTGSSGPVEAGRRLPGVPSFVAWGEIVWRSGAWHVGLEARHSAKVFVDDANSDAAPSYTVVDLRAGHEHRWGAWRLREFVRVGNVADRRYAGSVIVAESQGRHFEPAPGRNVFAGIEVSRAF